MGLDLACLTGRASRVGSLRDRLGERRLGPPAFIAIESTHPRTRQRPSSLVSSPAGSAFTLGKGPTI